MAVCIVSRHKFNMATTGDAGNRATTQVLMAQNLAGEQVPTAYIEGSLTNARKQKLFTAEYLPNEGDPTAILVFAHGMGEHCGRYKDVLSRFPTVNVAVYTYDAFGHGKSEPHEAVDRAYIPDFNFLVDDYELRVQSVKDAYAAKGKPLPPLFAAGHSLGGLTVAHAVARNPAPYAGIIMHSAAIDVEWNPVLRLQAAVGGLLAMAVPKRALVDAVRPVDMSQDAKVVADYIADPLNYTGKTKVKTANETLKAFTWLRTHASSMDLPLYMAHGTVDRCCSYKAAQRFFEQWRNKDKQFKTLEGGYHELLHGPEKQQCFEYIATWLKEHLGPRASL